MGEFIGASGGILMIALIVILLYRFIIDMGIGKDRIDNKRIGGYALAAVCLGLLQMGIGAMVISFVYDNPVSVFNIEAIWDMAPVVGDSGPMPLFDILVKLLGSLLFKKYSACALYISFLSGVVTYVTLGLVIRRYYADEEEFADRGQGLFVSLICLPASVFLFLPSSFAMFMALLGVFLLVWNGGKGNKIASFIMAVICLLTHVSGIIAVCLCIAGLFMKAEGSKSVIRDVIVMSVSQLVVIMISLVLGWGCDIEYMLVYAVPALACLAGSRIKIDYNVQSFVNVFMVLLSGFVICGKLTGLF